MKRKIIGIICIILVLSLSTAQASIIKTENDYIFSKNGLFDKDDYIIITSQSFKNYQGENSFHDLCTYHEENGLNTKIKTVESITNSYGGDDIQERIRNYIIDQNPEYVLLGGDHDVIPARYLWCDLSNSEHVTPMHVPSDNYYSSIDGDWHIPASNFYPSDKTLTPDDGGTMSGDGFFGDCIYYQNGGIMHWSCNDETDPDVSGYCNFIFDNPVDLSDYNWINFDLNVQFTANLGKTLEEIDNSGIWWGKLEVRFYDSSGKGTRVRCSTKPIWTGWETVNLDYRRTKNSKLEDTKRIEIKICTPVVDWTSRADITPDDYVEIKNLYFSDYNDDYWGEPGEDDLKPDVAIGRACVGSNQEIANFVGKTLSYLNTNDNEGYLKEAYLVGDGESTCNKIADGTSSTVGLTDDGYDCTKFFVGGSISNSEHSEVKQHLNNNNNHLVFSSGHGDKETSMAKAFDINDIKQLTNTNFFFEYSTGCSSGQFDDGDCYAEYITVKTEHGAFAGIWNTRPSYSEISEYVAKNFFNAICGEGIREIGRALNYAKTKCMPKVNDNELFYRAGMFEVTLFGDPAVQIKKLDTSENYPPNKPSKPNGKIRIGIGESYWYQTSTTDPNEDRIKYGWDWDGDGTVDEWTGFYNSGETITISHKWSEKGSYYIKVKANDTNGEESDWSVPLVISVTNNKIRDHPLIQRISEKFSLMSRLIHLPALDQLLSL